MAYYLTTVHPSGERMHEKLESAPSLDRIKDGIGGGLIEIVPHFDKYGSEDCVAFCDEEGKLKNFDMNTVATYLWYACLAPEPFRPDVLCGSILIIRADTKGELQAL